jgi:hypothetical protein
MLPPVKLRSTRTETRTEAPPPRPGHSLSSSDSHQALSAQQTIQGFDRSRETDSEHGSWTRSCKRRSSVDRFASIFSVVSPLFSEHRDYRALTRRINSLVAERAGRSAAAELCLVELLNRPARALGQRTAPSDLRLLAHHQEGGGDPRRTTEPAAGASRCCSSAPSPTSSSSSASPARGRGSRSCRRSRSPDGALPPEAVSEAPPGHHRTRCRGIPDTSDPHG